MMTYRSTEQQDLSKWIDSFSHIQAPAAANRGQQGKDCSTWQQGLNNWTSSSHHTVAMNLLRTILKHMTSSEYSRQQTHIKAASKHDNGDNQV